MSKSAEERAGELSALGQDYVRRGGHSLNMLAGHIVHMIKGIIDYPGPLWKVRLVPPDGRRIELTKFEDYLLRSPREGLGLESLAQVRGILSGTPGGDKALALVLKEIPDLNQRIVAEEARAAARRPLPVHGENQHTGGGDNITSSERGTGRAYTLRRLARDEPQLLARVERGELSAHAAAVEAGFRRPSKSFPTRSPEAALRALLTVFSVDELEAALRQLR